MPIFFKGDKDQKSIDEVQNMNIKLEIWCTVASPRQLKIVEVLYDVHERGDDRIGLGLERLFNFIEYTHLTT